MFGICAAIVLAIAPVQGGQGGFGGGAGAAAAGGQGGRAGDFGKEQTFEHILTPGDRTDWPLKLKAGEVVILRAKSTNFDPAIEVEDANHKKIAENDDEEEGKQDALLLIYSEKDGEYTAHVKNYRSTSGGAYTFSIQRFLTTTVELGKLTPIETKKSEVDIRIPAKKGQILTISNRWGYVHKVIGPDGKVVSPLMTNERLLPQAFEIPRDGDYFAHIEGRIENGKISVTASPARNLTALVDKTVEAEGNHPGIDSWTIHAKPGDFLRFEPKSASSVYLHLQKLPETAEGELIMPQPFSRVGEGSKWSRGLDVVFHKEGDYRFFAQPDEDDQPYSITVSKAWQPWDGVSMITGDLPLGGVKYYGFDAKPGHIVRLDGMAKTFDLVIVGYDHLFESIFEEDDTANTPNPSGTFAVLKGGRSYLAISCYGGGGGAYQIGAKVVPAQALTLGKPISIALNGPLDGLTTLNVDKAQTMSVRLKAKNARLEIYDPKGEPIQARATMVKEGDFMLFFDAKTAGEYRIWRQYADEPEKVTLTVSPVVD